MAFVAVVWFRKSERICGYYYPKGLFGFKCVGLIPRSGFKHVRSWFPVGLAPHCFLIQ
jgi:hypothetical protein